MISKYAYKGLTWIDLQSPTDEELAHVIDFKSSDALHFIVSNNTLVTSRRYNSPQIATFAKNFEMNIALDKPIQTDSIDSLFFELLSFFRHNAEHNKILSQKDEEILSLRDKHNRMLKNYSRRVLFLQSSIIFACIIILIIYIWQ